MCFLLTSMVQCWSNYSSPFLVLCFKSRIQRDSCKSAIKRSKYWSYANTGSFSKSSEPREKKKSTPTFHYTAWFFSGSWNVYFMDYYNPHCSSGMIHPNPSFSHLGKVPNGCHRPGVHRAIISVGIRQLFRLPPSHSSSGNTNPTVPTLKKKSHLAYILTYEKSHHKFFTFTVSFWQEMQFYFLGGESHISLLVGGWTNPSEKICASQIGSFPQVKGEKFRKKNWNHHQPVEFFCVEPKSLSWAAKERHQGLVIMATNKVGSSIPASTQVVTPLLQRGEKLMLHVFQICSKSRRKWMKEWMNLFHVQVL